VHIPKSYKKGFMSKGANGLSEIAIFLAGVVAASLITTRRGNPSEAAVPLDNSTSARLRELEARVEEQSAKLAEVPSTDQIVDAMEQLLARTMTSLDDRLTTQSRSIDVLKTTVSQTDSLLERVLESLDSLQNSSESLEVTEV
jgi:uncharacterized coiled-coil protein SlyX